MLAETPDYQAENLPLPFQKVDVFTTFFCEYTYKDNDIHFHFFRTEEVVRLGEKFWKLTFGQALDAVAREHFEAEYPRLQASFVDDVIRVGASPDQSESSWWMIAQEYGSVPDPDLLVEKFLEKLDQALENAIRT